MVFVLAFLKLSKTKETSGLGGGGGVFPSHVLQNILTETSNICFKNF